MIGLGLSLTQVAVRRRGGASGGGDGTARSAPQLTRVTGPLEYPPQVSFTRPIDWQDGDTAVMQRSQDPTFATGVSEATQTITAADDEYDFGLSAIGSDVWYWRMAAWEGSRSASLNWSNIGGVGIDTAPTITSDDTLNAYQGIDAVKNLTANRPGYWKLTHGTDRDSATMTGPAQYTFNGADAGAAYVGYTFTDCFELTATQTDTITVAANQPDELTFEPETDAALDTQYTPDLQQITGLVAPVSFVPTGGSLWAKGADNSPSGKTYATTPFMIDNGDFVGPRVTSSASYATLAQALATANGQDYTFEVTTLADPSGIIPTFGSAWQHNDHHSGETPGPAATSTFSIARKAGRRNIVWVVSDYRAMHIAVTVDGGADIPYLARSTGSPGTDPQIQLFEVPAPVADDTATLVIPKASGGPDFEGDVLVHMQYMENSEAALLQTEARHTDSLPVANLPNALAVAGGNLGVACFIIREGPLVASIGTPASPVVSLGSNYFSLALVYVTATANPTMTRPTSQSTCALGAVWEKI